MKGQMVGHKIGFPTINIAYSGNLDLSFGVYAAVVDIFDREDKELIKGTYKGALHFGPRAVLGLSEPSLEVHLLDFADEELYGRQVKVEIFDKIRDTKNFDNMQQLKHQIRLDVEAVREIKL